MYQPENAPMESGNYEKATELINQIKQYGRCHINYEFFWESL